MRLQILVLLFSGLLTAGCLSHPSAGEDQPKASDNVVKGELPTVTVPLLGSTRDVQGIDLPKSIHGPGVGGFDLAEPCELIVPVSGRRPIRLHVQRMTILAKNGLVAAVYIWRPLQPLGFKAVVADLLRTLKDQGIEPGRQMKEHMKTWPEDQPDGRGMFFPIPYKTGIHTALGEIGSIDVRMSSIEGGWFYMWEISGGTKANYATQILDPDSPKQAIAIRGPDAGRLSGRPARTQHPVPLRGASLRLPGTTKDIDGLVVPRELIVGKSGMAQVARPHALTINRSHTKPLSLIARKSSVTIREGAVQDVTLVRPVLSSPFQKAIEDIVGAVEAEDADPAMAKALIADWSEKSGAQEFKAVLRGVFAELEADVHMKKDVDTGGWSYTMTFRPAAAPVVPPARQAVDQRSSGPARPEQPIPAAREPARALKGQMRTALPRVSLHLPGAARQVEGVDVPADVLAGKPGRIDIDHPCELTVLRVGGKTMRMPMRGASLAFRDGQVEGVTARRPYMPLPLEKAVADLRSVAKGLHINEGDFETRIRNWLRQAGSPEFLMTLPGVPEGLDLEIHLKKQADTEHWSYTLTFRATDGLGTP